MKTEETPYELRTRVKNAQLLSFRRFLTFKTHGYKLNKYLGNDLAGVREWIESNFTDGMTWHNYGKVWVVDHIVPIRIFNIFDEEDLALCWHYKNLMPLFKEDNIKKEGNVFFAFELLHELKDRDTFFMKLYEKVKPEVEWMVKYIDKYHAKYNL